MFGNGGWAGESFESAGRAANRARGLKAGFVNGVHRYRAFGRVGAGRQLRAQSAKAAGFRLSVDARHGGSREADGPDLLRNGSHEILLRGMFAGGPARSDPGAAISRPTSTASSSERRPLNQTGTHLARAYWMKGMNANPFPAAKLGLLAKRVYDSCDARDGLKDGLIDDPRRCDFKPARDLPHCAAGADQGDCFTADQIAVAGAYLWRCHESGKTLFSGLASGGGSRRAQTDRAVGWDRRLMVPTVRAPGHRTAKLPTIRSAMGQSGESRSSIPGNCSANSMSTRIPRA